MSRLGLAIRRGRLADVKRQVCCRTMNATNPGAESPLLLAYKRGRLDLLDILLCYGPRTADVINIFNRAARDGQEGILKLLLAGDEKAGLFSRDDCRELTKALHLAAKAGRQRVVRILFEYGASIDGRDGKNRTPLYHAFTGGHVQTVATLVDCGGSIRIRSGGHKVVESAVMKGNVEMVEALLKRGRPDDYDDGDDDIDDDEDEDYMGYDDYVDGGGTALHIATAKGNPKIVETLLKAGFDVDAENEEGTRPIHMALKHAKILHLLLKYGADVNARDGNYDTPLHIASEDYNIKAVKTLLQYGANVEARNRKNISVVGLALKMMYLPLLELLWDFTDHIDHLCCTTYEGGRKGGFVPMNAIEFACSWRMIPVVSALLERGANFMVQGTRYCERLAEGRSAAELSEIPDVFEQHFIKLKTAGLTADEAYKKHPAVPLTLTPLQRKQFQEKCAAEVSRTKEERIPGTNHTFYEVFKYNDALYRDVEVIHLFRPEGTEGLRSRFPEYFRLLHVHFRRGFERRRLTDRCHPVLPILAKVDLPVTVIDKICGYLSPKELAILIELADPITREWTTPMEFRPPCCESTFVHLC